MFSAKDGLKYLADGDPKLKYKHKTKKFRCDRDPVHSKCKKERRSFAPRDHYDRILWEVEWAPCREEDATEYMRDAHGHHYTRPHHKGHGKSHSKSEDKARSGKHSIPSAPGPSQRPAAPAPASYQNTPAQAAGSQYNQHHQMQPPTAFPVDTPSPRETPLQQENKKRVEAWIPDPQLARPPHSRRTRSSRHSSRGNSVQGSMGEMGAGTQAPSARGTPIPPGMQLSSVMVTHHTRQPFPSSMSPFPGRQPVPPPSVPSPPLTHSDDDWDSP